MQLRTDLAIEAREIAGDRVSGTAFSEHTENGLKISRLEVKSRKAKQILGKDIGTYITIELPSLTDNFTEADERIKTIGGEIGNNSRFTRTENRFSCSVNTSYNRRARPRDRT